MAQKRWSLDIYEKEREEMEQNRYKAQQITQESVNSTRNMLQLVDECQDAGVNTLRFLHLQGESLNRTEHALDDIDANLKDGEMTLKRISTMNKVPLPLLPFYLLVKKDAPASPERSQVIISSKDKTKRRETIKKEEFMAQSTFYEENHGEKERFFGRISHDPDEEEEIEKNLGLVSNHLTLLKGQAIEMGSTVVSHNSQLDRMHTKAESNQYKLKEVSKKTKKLTEGDSSDSISPSSCFKCAIS